METTSFMSDHTKTAIAKLLVSAINADGMVYEAELDYLEKNIKGTYGLSADNFKRASTMSLAEAIKTIVTAANNGLTVARKNNGGKTEGLYASLLDDITALAHANGIISTEEAMIIISLRYAFDVEGARIFEYERNSIKLAKSEVIFIDDAHTGHYQELRMENEMYGDALYGIMASCGFQYIDIASVKKQLAAYPRHFMQRTIGFLHPDKSNSDETINKLYAKMTSSDVSEFGCQIMEEGKCGRDFQPSLLFKVSESAVVRSDGSGYRTMFDLLQVPIPDGCSILDTMQSFVRKYRDLVETCHNESKSNGRMCGFNIRSFHKTLLDFYLALDREPECMVLKVANPRKGANCIDTTLNSKKVMLVMSEYNNIFLSKSQFTGYLMVLYFHKKGMPLERIEVPITKGTDLRKVPKELRPYYEVFAAIQYATNDDMDRYDKLFKHIDNTSGKIKNIKSKNGYNIAHCYDRNRRTYSVSFTFDVLIEYTEFVGGKFETKMYGLYEWIEHIKAALNEALKK